MATKKVRFAEGQIVTAARHIAGFPAAVGTRLTIVSLRAQRGCETRYCVDDSNVYRGWAYQSDLEAV